MTKHIITVVLNLICFLSFADAQQKSYQQRKIEQLENPSPFQQDIDGITKRILYKDNYITILDGSPALSQLPIHLLAVPNKRISTLNETTEKEEWLLGHMVYMLKNQAKKKGVDSTGYRITFNTNEDAGQSAFHLHAHLLGGAKTGAMVEQSWRNIQRAKRAATDTTYRTATTKDIFLARMMGLWITDAGNAEMLCEPELNFRYMKLSFKRQIISANQTMLFEGRGIYKPGKLENTYEATWYDSGGEILPIVATAIDNTLEAIWGNAGGKQGKTLYTFLNDTSLQVTDFILRGGEWKEFSNIILNKKW